MSSQKSYKINIFDILIVLAIIAAILYIGYTLIVVPMQDKGVAKKVEFTVEVPITSLDIANLVKEGDTVTVLSKAKGTVKKVTSQPAKKLVLDATTGKYKFSVVPQKYDLYVTVVGNANETETAISIDNTPIRIGAKVSVEGKGFSVNGSVLDMNLIDSESGVSE